MSDFSGRWTGQIMGTNEGGLTIDVKHQGDRVRGSAAINDSRLGTYEYSFEGRMHGPELNFSMTPRKRSSELIAMGKVRGTAVLISDSELSGQWTSDVGTRGTLIAHRDPQHFRRSESATPVRRRQRPRRGTKIDAYNLVTRLGSGHSAEVWQATVARSIDGVDLTKGDQVAIKIYSDAMLQGMQTVRIQREFMIAIDAEHENLARVYDLVLSPSRPFHTFMVMEYVKGRTLKQIIEAKGPLTPPQVIRVAQQLFGALEELHSLKAIHRDVKAANIMIAESSDDDLNVKLVDLGIVALQQEDRFTQHSVFLGSKHSAPLEQLLGEPVNELTDIYGAGSVLYHCLTGKPMYDSVGPEAAIARQMENSPDRLQNDGDQLSDFHQWVHRGGCPQSSPQYA